MSLKEQMSLKNRCVSEVSVNQDNGWYKMRKAVSVYELCCVVAGVYDVAEIPLAGFGKFVRFVYE